MEEKETHNNSQHSAWDEQIHKISNQVQSYSWIDIWKVKILDCIEKHHWCCIVYDAFSKH